MKTELEDEPGSRRSSRRRSARRASPRRCASATASSARRRDRRAAYLCHGFCELGARPLADALRDIRDFLVENPGEVVLIVIEDYVPPADIARGVRARAGSSSSSTRDRRAAVADAAADDRPRTSACS